MSRVATISAAVVALAVVCMAAGRVTAMDSRGLDAKVDAKGISDFKARYRASYGILPIGEYRLSFDRLGEGRYRYESDTEPSGLVRLFSDKRVVEQSEGRWTPDGPRPERYERRVYSDDGWQTDVIVLGDHPRVITPGGEHRIDPPPGALDPAGLLLQIIHDFRRGHLDGEYTLVDKDGKSRQYRTRDMGAASVEVMGRSWQARHMRRLGGSPSHGLDVYLAPGLGGLPVRIDYVAKGRRFKMYLDDLQGIPVPTKDHPSTSGARLQ